MSLQLLLFLALFVLSLGILLKASDWFVDAAEEIGLSFGISPFIIGVTIVAFGTSLPELSSSIAAVYAGNSEIVVGNVVGSNIANLLLVLGLSSIVAKQIELKFEVVDNDVPFLLGSAVFLWFTCRDLEISKFETVLYLGGLAIFLINSFKREKRADKTGRPKAGWQAYFWMITGAVLVYFSAEWIILSIQKISEIAGLNTELIALSLVAFGTSLPEVAVSIAAVRKGKTGIAIGNVVGSNIFNSFAVMGIARLFGELTIPENVLEFSLPFLFAVTVMFAIISISRLVSRWEGVLLVLFYVFFIGELFKGSF